MTVTAIIAEYNPFHLGHKYHIEQARALTNADVIVSIMSGNFVQRGEPAIFDKHLRAKVAISCGADMVLELPYPYSCSSAEYFADSAVTMLDKLGCIDYLCFGSEWNNTAELYDIANILISEPSEYKAVLKEQLKLGQTFPKARHIALMELLKDAKYEEILKSPNNILGIEYIKSLIRLNSNIKPITIKRIISDYHHKNGNNPYYSASSIRNDYANGVLDITSLSEISPVYADDNLYPLNNDDFSSILAYRLLDNCDKLDEFMDISSDLADRIQNNIDKYNGFNEFIELLKTKNTNYSSISRVLCHIMLDITKKDIEEFKCNGYADYMRVLCFNDNALKIFKTIETCGTIKLITKISKAHSILSELASPNKKLFDKNMFADNLYRIIVQGKYDICIPNEFQHQVKM